MNSDINNFRFHFAREERAARREFGEKVRSIRKELGMTVRDMATKMSISVDALVRIEGGFVDPDTPHLKKRLELVKSQRYLTIAI